MAIYQRQYRYGITAEEYDKMFTEQKGECAICRDILTVPHVDHNHITGEVRGLLCPPCNKGIGHLGDSELKAARAVVYLLGGI
jgi:hypothetical protein